jgi:hypothetical protein
MADTSGEDTDLKPITVEKETGGGHIVTRGDTQTVVPPGGLRAHLEKHFNIGEGLKKAGESLSKTSDSGSARLPRTPLIAPKDENPTADWNVTKT